MKKEFKLFSIVIITFIALITVIFIINQLNAIYNLSAAVNPVFGQAVLIALIAICLGLIILPAIYIMKLPGQLKPPAEEDTEEYKRYLAKLRKRLLKNPALAEISKELNEIEGDKEAVKTALSELNRQANQVIEDISGYVFVSTAISQNGVFDAVIVLIAQIRMVWQVAYLYNQRPTLKSIIKLYLNVAATVFIVREIEDFELLEDQLEPMIASVLGSSLGGIVPVVNTASVIMINSMVRGSANTFLTLRVGVIAKKYSKPLHQEEEKAKVRKAASGEACLMLGRVLGKSAKVVTKSVYNASKRATKRAGQAGKDKVLNIADESKNIAEKIISKIKN